MTPLVIAHPPAQNLLYVAEHTEVANHVSERVDEVKGESLGAEGKADQLKGDAQRTG
jgi:hypothetical protein